MAGIRLEHIRKSYGPGMPDAIRDLDMEIGAGEFLCLLGPSGCGKTTTLRMIAGLEHPTSGRILVDDTPVVSVADGLFTPPEKRGMGLVFQNYALWPHMTVRENVAFGLGLRNGSAAERDRTVGAVTETLGISHLADRYPTELSGGQQQRVALARMLALDPAIILLDEPLSNLDAKLRLEMRAELKRIHAAAGSTIVFVTHDQWEAMTLATTIAVMSDGALQQVGTPDDIYERPANRFVAEFVGTLPINIVEMDNSGHAPLVRWLRSTLEGTGRDVGAARSAGIRPETVRVDPAGGDTSGNDRATVVDIVPTGGSWIVELDVHGLPFFAIVGDNPQARIGDQVAFQVATRHVHLFDAQSRRIDS